MPEPIVKLIDEEGKETVFPLERKTFSTGSVGYSTSGRVFLKNESGEQKSHTFNVNVIEIGSKHK